MNLESIFQIAVFEGDGIGPEIMAPTLEILRSLQSTHDQYSLTYEYAAAGATHYLNTGESLPASSIEAAASSHAILLSAMGLPDVRYPDGTEISPQIELRKKFDLYAGVRPVTVQAVTDQNRQLCPLIRPNGESIDFVLIRESTEGLFHTQGTGTVTETDATETLLITRAVSEKLFDFAFKLAQQRRASGAGQGRVTCVDKANVFRAFAFFRKIFYERAQNFADINAQHAYVDATALRMVQQPWDFDVLVTENMFGDILSDLGAGIMGGLGLAPSADIGDNHAVFQPCHGSAPDIAGKGIANPFAMILSAAMMLDWLGHRHNTQQMIIDSALLKKAVNSAMADSTCITSDIGGSATTAEAADAVIKHLVVQ